MNAIVVDAGVVLDLLVDVSAGAGLVRARLRREPAQWAAPELMYAEVAHVPRRQVLRGDLASADASLALAELIALPLWRCPHPPLLARAFELRDNATIYDALYLSALARVPGVGAPVEVIAPVS